MVREEKVLNTKTLAQAIMLLSKKQLDRFSAIVAWYQVHYHLNYFLDERNTMKLFIDLFIGKRLSNKTIGERRSMVLSHLELYLKDGMEPYLIELAKAAAERKTIRELRDIAHKVIEDYGI